MGWATIEYVLKGLFLGLVVYAALQIGIDPNQEENPRNLLLFNIPILVGLGLALGTAAVLKLRQGYSMSKDWLFFLILLFLECHGLIYLGILGGAVVGAVLIYQGHTLELLGQVLLGGILFGFIFVLQRLIQRRWIRLSVILLMATGIATGFFLYLVNAPDSGFRWEIKSPALLALQLLLGIPFFYALTFSGRQEETEIEIGAMCATLGISLSILTLQQPGLKSLGTILPFVLYLGYTVRILPSLRVFKHVLRGLAYFRMGRHRQALQAFRRAIQLDPGNQLARKGFWNLHRNLDLDQVRRDPQFQALLDCDLCLDRVRGLLLGNKPDESQLQEVDSLLSLVLNQQPTRGPSVAYWKAVALTHQNQIDSAATELTSVLDPSFFGRENQERQPVLVQAWQLGLLLHEELRRRVGEPQLALPGRRMEAIAAVEQFLAQHPDDQSIWNLKRILYNSLQDAEYFAENPNPNVDSPTIRFDYAYVQQLGLALIHTSEGWLRGVEYLRMAAHGLPQNAPSMLVLIGQAYAKQGQTTQALKYYEEVKQAGKQFGVTNLPPEEAELYFGTVKYLADAAQARGDVDTAIENLRIYTESSSSGIETLRTLAGLCESKGDVLSALRFNDMALIYNSKDKDLLARKDRYYFSLMPDVLQSRLESIRSGFDLDYCIRKAQSILDNPQLGDLEWLEVAHHLIQLALVLVPENLRVRFLLARVQLRSGERDRAMELLKTIRSPKPEKFASSDEEDAWYQASQVLGDLYMEVGQPEEAIPCFQDFRSSHRSGARTLFKLALAHEQLGENNKAIKLYKLVTGYEGNPLVSDAYSALNRLGA